MTRLIPGVALFLNFILCMMAIQILTGTWSWPGPETIPLSRQLSLMVAVGILGIVWNAMAFFVWSRPIKIIGDKPE